MRRAQIVTLFAASIGAAETAQVSTPVVLAVLPRLCALQARFAYGSGGTSATYWVQTSLDGGTTWIDVACFAFLLAAATKAANLSAATPVTTVYAPTDGTLGNDTVKDGLLGDRFRVKRTTVGTYAGATTITIVAHVKD